MLNFSNRQTTLDLNGPVLSIVQQPTSVSICYAGVATFIGIATVSFPNQNPENNASNTGILTYRWYDQDGPLFDDPPPEGGDGLTISGAATTTLTLYDNTKSRTLHLRPDYIYTAYSQPVGSAVTVGTSRSTGNANNEIFDSESVSLTVFPTISLTSEPLDSTIIPGKDATFNVTATTSDGSDLIYQWQLNDVDLIDSSSEEKTIISTPSSSFITVTDDSTGTSTDINFSEIASYSNFVPGKTYTLVSSSNIETKISAIGGGGGTSINRSVSGGSGGTASGTFTFISGQTYKLVVGSAGGTGGSAGFPGGGSGGGGTGRGGGGGGYTGIFIDSVAQSNSILIAAGGGGGNDDPATGGSGGGTSGSGGSGRNGGGGTQTSGGSAGGADGSNGTPGSALQGGSGGAGGGGGYFGGGGGQSYSGCCAGGSGGGGSSYLHPSLLSNAITELGGGNNAGKNGSFSIEIQGPTEVTLTSVSGANTPNLTISSSIPGLSKVRCIVSHPTSCDPPLITREANFTVVEPRQIIVFENIRSSSRADIYTWNLFNNPLDVGVDIPRSLASFYASERDIDVEMEIHAKHGSSSGANRGGRGGYAKVRFTMRQNEEYMSASFVFGGIFIYRKSRLIFGLGEGGNASSAGRGGDGGGLSMAGERGGGRGGGNGGAAYLPGTLPSSGGIFGSSFGGTPSNGNDSKAPVPLGGRALACPRGRQTVSPCTDLGQTRFLWGQSTPIPSTAVIDRGFKQGYGIRQTAGLGSGGGNGGGGVTGGDGGTSGGGGGGGGGYTDGSVEVIETSLGGSLYPSGAMIIRAIL